MTGCILSGLPIHQCPSAARSVVFVSRGPDPAIDYTVHGKILAQSGTVLSSGGDRIYARGASKDNDEVCEWQSIQDGV